MIVDHIANWVRYRALLSYGVLTFYALQQSDTLCRRQRALKSPCHARAPRAKAFSCACTKSAEVVPISWRFAKHEAVATVIGDMSPSRSLLSPSRAGPDYEHGRGRRGDLMRCLLPRAAFGAENAGREAICFPQKGRPWVGFWACRKIHPVPVTFSRARRLRWLSISEHCLPLPRY
jgi:hypothetical protein